MNLPAEQQSAKSQPPSIERCTICEQIQNVRNQLSKIDGIIRDKLDAHAFLLPGIPFIDRLPEFENEDEKGWPVPCCPFDSPKYQVGGIFANLTADFMTTEMLPAIRDIESSSKEVIRRVNQLDEADARRVDFWEDDGNAEVKELKECSKRLASGLKKLVELYDPENLRDKQFGWEFEKLSIERCAEGLEKRHGVDVAKLSSQLEELVGKLFVDMTVLPNAGELRKRFIEAVLAI